MYRNVFVMSALLFLPATVLAQEWQLSVGAQAGSESQNPDCRDPDNSCSRDWGTIVEIDRTLRPSLQLSGRFSGMNTSHRLGIENKGQVVFEYYTASIGLRMSRPGPRRTRLWAKLALGYLERVTLLKESYYLDEKQRMGGVAAIWSVGFDYDVWSQRELGIRVRFFEFAKWKHSPYAFRRAGISITKGIWSSKQD